MARNSANSKQRAAASLDRVPQPTNKGIKMNESSEALIRELAEKLGTTGEHLWGVLLRQAPISAAVDAVEIGGLVFALWLAFRIILSNSKTPAATKEDPYPTSRWDDDLCVIAWIAWVGGAAIVTLLSIIAMSRIVNALFNPEYWALMKLLN